METIDLSKYPFGTLVELRNGDKAVITDCDTYPDRIYGSIEHDCEVSWNNEGLETYSLNEHSLGSDFDVVRIISVPQQPSKDRESDIHAAACYSEEYFIPSKYKKGLVEGAKWADAHPINLSESMD